MVVGRNNGVVGLTGFSDKKMSGHLFAPKKSGRNNGVVVWRGSTVLKWWRHKNEIMGFVRIFWENNVQEAYLPKVSISGQIVSEMLAGCTQKTPYKPF